MTEVEIRLSGTVEVRRDGQLVELPGRRVRALLVLLAVSAGESVSIDTLARGIWDDDPPERIRGSVQTCVGRLRRAIGGDVVVRTTAGYTLALPRSDVDLLRFEDIVTSAAGRENPEDEITALESGLALWRGDPFGDVPSTWIERQLVSPWVERYLGTVERRVDKQIATGDHASCVPELRDLIERYPLRETLWARLLTALADGGRTADALERYEVLRARLAGELGVDPSPELQEAYQRLLAAEPPAGSVPRPSRSEVPHQLPAGIDGFTGRADRLAALDTAVDVGARTVAVHGPGGVGKTSVAIQWARQARDRFPDGELFVDLRGYGPGEPLSPVDALDLLLRGLGVPGGRIPADEDGRAALLRSELSDRRTLLLLDNARAASQVRPLLPGGENVVIVTSRSQLRGLVSREGARRVRVDPMPPADAVALLRGRLGDSDGVADAEELAELADLCGHLPVALVIAAERAGRDSSPSLELVNERLRSEGGRVAALADWDDDPLGGVRAVFAWSYDLLDADAARMFRLLGLQPDSQFAVHAAAAFAGTDSLTSELLLDRLADAHLLRELRPGWYEIHDLTRAYAAEVCAALEPVADRDAAVDRLRSWYLHSIRNAQHAMQAPLVEPETPDLLSGVTPVEFEKRDDAVGWLTDHHRSIRALFASAVADEDHTAVIAVASPLSAYVRQVIVALREAVDMFGVAYRSAERIGDPLAKAVCANDLGLAHYEYGDYDTAMTYLTQSRDLFHEVDDSAGRLMVESNIGVLLERQGRLEEATECQRRALLDAQSPELWELRARIENNLANCYLLLGRHEQALAAATSAVQTARNTQSRISDMTVCLITLAEAQQANAEWRASAETLDEALTWCRAGASVRNEIVALKYLGMAHEALGRSAAARQTWEHAVELLEGIDTMKAYGVSVADLRAMVADLPAED